MPLIAALGGATIISFSAILFAAADVAPTTGAFFRAAYAVPVLWAIWFRTRSKDSRDPRARWLARAAGVMLGLDFITWHLSIDHIGAGLGTLLANSQVVLVPLLAWMIFGEKPSRVVAVAIPVLFAGVALVSGLGRSDSFGENPVLGTVFGLIAALMYSGYLLALRHSNQAQAPAAGSLFDATLGAAVTCLLAGPIVGGLDLVPAWPSHGWLLVLALGPQVLGWLAISYALPRLPAAETSTFILLQPVLTMVWGALIFAERPSALQLLGAGLVLVGVGAVAVFSARRRPVEEPAGV